MLHFRCFILLFFLFTSSEALPEPQGEACAPYFTSVFDSNSAISAGLLQNESLAIICLVDALKKLSLDIVSPAIQESKRDALNRATAALLRIMDRGKQTAIDKIRDRDDISVASVLSLGARNENRETRLNCTNLLSNIIDNSTVCVPMDHLADPALPQSEWGKNGRANLLAVVSVVAPWAQKSNYNNMKQLEAFLRNQLEGEADIQQTKDILSNFSDRLSYQDGISNPNKNIDAPIMEECQNMPTKWAKPPQQFILNYPR